MSRSDLRDFALVCLEGTLAFAPLFVALWLLAAF